jgi:serine/threonine protein kinase
MVKGAFTEDLTQEGVMVGTPRYMAPEQFDGSAAPASDLYALGTIIYQALTGHLPFRGNTLAEFMVAKLSHPIPRIREIAPMSDTPESLESLVLALLNRAPQDRPPLDVVFQHLNAVEEEVFGTPHSLRRNSMTGSGPVLPPSSVSGVQPQLRVPYTIVGAPPSLPPSMGMTPRPTASSARPPPTSSMRALTGVVIAIGALAIAGVGLIGLWAKNRADKHDTTAASSNVAPPPAASSAPAKNALVLTIESTPSGATVTEDDKVLGETPLPVPIDPASVTAGPRTFLVHKEGYLASTVQQGASDATTKTVAVTLAPDPMPHVKSHAGPPKPAGGASTAKQQPTQPQGNGPLDIRMNR